MRVRFRFTKVYISLVGVAAGFAASVFASAWTHLLPPFTADPVVADTWIVCSMFAWLLAGSLYFGRKVARVSSHLRLLAFTLIGTGISAILVSQVFPAVETAVRTVAGSYPHPSAAASVVGAALTSAAVFVPFFLLGGIVVFCLEIGESGAVRTGDGGIFFPFAFAGGAAAVFASTLGLVPALGHRRTLIITAVAVAAVGLTGLSRSEQYRDTRLRDSNVTDSNHEGRGRAGYFAHTVFVVGAVASSILWARLVIETIGRSDYAWALLTGVYLASMAIGAVIGQRAVRSSAPASSLSLIAALTGLALLALGRFASGLPLVFSHVARWGGSPAQNILGAGLAVSVVAMLLPGILLGCSLAVLSAARPRDRGTALCPVVASACAGCLLAFVLTRFIPTAGFGFRTALASIPWLCLAGGAYFAVAGRPRRTPRLAAYAVAALIAIVLVVALPEWDRHLITGAMLASPQEAARIDNLREAVHSADMIFYEETPAGIVALARTPDQISLKANGVRIGSVPEGMTPQILTGHIALLMHAQPRKVLILGISNGVTLSAVAAHPVDEIVCVEPMAPLVRAAGLVTHYNGNVLADRRVSVHVGDAANYLMSARNFDVIIVEHPSYQGSRGPDILTVDFGELVRSALGPNGIACYRLNIVGIPQEVFQSTARGFASLFPSVSLWWAAPDQVVLLGSMAPTQAEIGVTAARLADRGIGDDLTRTGFGDAFGLLNWYMMDRDRLMQFVGDSPPNTRDKNLAALRHPKVPMPPDQLMTLRILDGGSEPLIPVSAGAIGDSARFEEIRNKMGRCTRARLRYLESLESRNAGLLPQAISALGEASQLCPNNGIYRIHLADYLLHQSQAQAAAGRTDEAIDAARRSIEAYPSGHRGFYQLGSLEADRRPAVSIALLGKAIELNPHYVPGYLLKAQTELISGEAEEASRTLGAALSIEPLNLTAHHLRALSFIERNMLDEARVEIDRVIRADPDNVEALGALAYTWLIDGDLDRAENLYRAVLRRRPDHLAALNNYGTILAEKGDFEGAVRTWTKALSLDPGNRDIIDNIEEARQKMRRR